MKFERGLWSLQPDTTAIYPKTVTDVQIEDDALQTINALVVDRGRVLRWQHAVIRVAVMIGQGLAEMVGEVQQNLAVTGRPETDRTGHALVLGDAVMGNAGRNIEHVTWFQYPFLLRRS